MESVRPLKENKQHGDFLFPVSAYETVIENEIQMPLYFHWHPETEIFFITSGKMDFQVEGVQFVLEEGDVLLIKPNTLHGSHDFFGARLQFRAVVFDYGFLAGIGNDRIEQEYLRPLLLEGNERYLLFRKGQMENQELYHVLNRIYEIYCQQGKGYEILLRSLLLQVIYQVIQQKEESGVPKTGTRKSKMIRRIVEYAEHNYMHRISLGQLAEYLSLSEGYLSRFFKENFRMTFVEYMQRFRLQKAARLLRETDEPIGKIALDVGFGSGNYFATEFGKYYHTTPQKYRKGHEIEKNSQYM